ncbi:MAG: response regulator, partial [Acidobacteriota bacterium]|nr:response regulator [Acidobacteriota bacterium]
YAREEDQRRALSTGFEKYLTKPIEPADLLSAVAGAGRRRRGELAPEKDPLDGFASPPATAGASPPSEDGSVADKAAERAAGPSPGRRVLVVEDDPDSREALKTLLEIGGHTVEVAASGLEGVEKALGARPDAAVIDIGLPEIDGHEVARRIRAELGQNGMLLIALTGYLDEADKQKAKTAGFDAHLAKPVQIGQLYKLLD